MYKRQDLLPHPHPIGRRRDAAHRQAVDGQQSADAAAHVAKSAKGFNMGHGAGQDIAGGQLIQIICLALALGFGPREQIAGVSLSVLSLIHI